MHPSYKFSVPEFSNFVVLSRFSKEKGYLSKSLIINREEAAQRYREIFPQASPHVTGQDATKRIWELGRQGAFIQNFTGEYNHIDKLFGY